VRDPSPAAGPTSSGLNLKQVAAELGVHYMTAYRYVRQGRLPARMVDGGWVVSRTHLDEFRHRDDGPSRAAAPDVSPAAHAQRLRPLLESGDETEAWRVIDRLVLSGTSPRRWLTEILPAALVIPEPGDELALARSYVAAATATRLVDRLAARHVRPGRPRGTVLLAGATGEQHRLPLGTVAALARIDGYRTVELGIDVPPAVIVAATDVAELLAVGIGVTTVSSIDAAAEAVTGIRRRHPDLPVIVGGQAVRNPHVAAAIGTPWWAPDGIGMADLLRGLVAERTRRRRASRAR
jgi:excisionase family DNA binding protein